MFYQICPVILGVKTFFSPQNSWTKGQKQISRNFRKNVNLKIIPIKKPVQIA